MGAAAQCARDNPVMCTPIISVPEHVVTQDDTLRLLEGLVPPGHPKTEKFKAIVQHARVAERHLVRPLSDTLKHTGLAERQAAFEAEAPKLALDVAARAMA